MDAISHDMTELVRAVKLQERAACAGFDWPGPEPVLDKLREETGELIEAMATGKPERIEDELGDLLFVLTNLARQLGVNPETALRRANAKFERRFRAMEQAAGGLEQLRGMNLDQMEDLWQQVKAMARAAANDGSNT
ncbi:MAG: MazG nucleotide pyrophosphohydrolase domain-containing protein [Lysobacterales bacterium]